MGRLTSTGRSLGKSLYFYATLYCIGTIGMVIVTINRHDIIYDKLDMVNWGEMFLLLGLLYSLPVLFLTFIQRVNKSLAITIAGSTCFIIFIVYWISSANASDMITTIRNVLNPILGIFFIGTAFIMLVKVWPRGTR